MIKSPYREPIPSPLSVLRSFFSIPLDPAHGFVIDYIAGDKNLSKWRWGEYEEIAFDDASWPRPFPTPKMSEEYGWTPCTATETVEPGPWDFAWWFGEWYRGGERGVPNERIGEIGGRAVFGPKVVGV